jgi:hypothetical protein
MQDLAKKAMASLTFPQKTPLPNGMPLAQGIKTQRLFKEGFIL